MENELTQEMLKSRLDYNPETGIFTRKFSPSRNVAAGSIPGKIKRDGYKFITINGREYPSHRLAWMYVTGAWPLGCIDHINGNRTDNRIQNLRDVSTSENLQNQRVAHRDNKTGFLGVSRKGVRFVAKICVNYKDVHLGTFPTPETAHAAYISAKRNIHGGCTI